MLRYFLEIKLPREILSSSSSAPPNKWYKFRSQPIISVSVIFKYSWLHSVSSSLTFKNRASYIQDGRTATLQMLHFIYIFFQQI
jgi:hypothetical protein